LDVQSNAQSSDDQSMKGEVAMNATKQDARPSGQRSVNRCSCTDRQATAPGGGDPFLGRSSRPPSSTSGWRLERPGLELKYRSLVVVSVLAATGHNEELKTHLRGALKLGWTVDQLREALLQTAPYAGFPRLTRRSRH